MATDAPTNGMMLTISLAPLDWAHRDSIYARCPITGTEYAIAHEEEKFWGCWAGAPIEGSSTTEEVKEAAETHRADRVLHHLRVNIEGAPEPEADPRLAKAWALGRDAAVHYHEQSERALNVTIEADDTLISRDRYGARMAGHNADAMMLRSLTPPDDLDAQVDAE